MPEPIYTTNQLAWRVGIPERVLVRLAETAGRHYSPFEKRKGSKVRRIDNPTDRLKSVQRAINSAILKNIPLGSHLHGGVPGRSPKTNVEPHLGSRCIVRVDIRSFYPSITDHQVYRVWVERGRCTPPVASLLTRLVTYRHRLPQGAPTSCTLANLVLLDADTEIRTAAELAGLNYTRFVDDLVFSGENPRTKINDVIRVISRAGFAVSRSKTLIMPRHKRQAVTGYCINSGVPSIARADRDRVRSAIHQLQGLNPRSEPFRKSLASVRGRIRYVGQVNVGAGRRLERRLTEVVGA